jgi:hypothetical protein
VRRSAARSRLGGLTERWRQRHDARQPVIGDRPFAEPERQARAAAAFPYLTQTPVDYVAAHGHDMPGFTFDDERYDDPGLDAWLREVGALLRERRA